MSLSAQSDKRLVLLGIIRLSSVVTDVAGKLSHHSIIVGCIITRHIANLV